MFNEFQWDAVDCFTFRSRRSKVWFRHMKHRRALWMMEETHRPRDGVVCRVKGSELFWRSEENLNNFTVVTDQQDKRLLLSYSTFFLNCVDSTLSLKHDSSSLPQTSVQRSHYLPPERCFSVASAATGHLFLSLYFSDALPCCNII